MKNTITVLKLLIESRKAFTIREISRKLKMNYRIAFEETKKLQQKKLITITKAGNSSQCTFTNVFSREVLEAEEARKEEALENPDLKIIYNDMEKIKSPFFILLLFGSYAKGKNSMNSDIDLCIIADNENTVKEAERAISILPHKIHLIDFTAEQFMQMLDTRKDNVGKEILEKGIILSGIEDFYRLLAK